MYTYFLNCMGPVSMSWYEERGLTYIETKVIDTEFKSKLWGKKLGEEYQVLKISQRYSCGRVDIHHPDTIYNDEYGVSIMKESSWVLLGSWLGQLKTKHLVSYNQLIEMFERETNSSIEWLENI